MTENDLPSKFDEAIVEAIVELLDAYGLSSRIEYLEPMVLRDSMLATAIAFVGSGLRGSLLVMASRKTIAATQSLEWTEPKLRDWIGELGNQALGCIRRKLISCGLNAVMSLPAVLGSIRLDIQGIDERYTRAHAFATEVGTVVVCIDVVAMGRTEVSWDAPEDSDEPNESIF
jgi:hypothetical protein